MKYVAGSVVAGAVVLGPGLPAFAATSTHHVIAQTLRDGYASSPSATDNLWYREDTRVGGGSTISSDFGAPLGSGPGSLVLTTNSLNSAKTQLMTSDTVRGHPLTDLSTLSFWSYQSLAAGSSPEAGPSFQLRVDFDNNLSTTGDQTTLVYEPYWNDVEGPSPQQPLAPDIWQQWNTLGGQWWSSKQITCGAFSVAPGAGGPPFTTPGDVSTNCANAKIVEIGVNAGSSNPKYIVGVNGIHIVVGADDVTWNFAKPK